MAPRAPSSSRGTWAGLGVRTGPPYCQEGKSSSAAAPEAPPPPSLSPLPPSRARTLSRGACSLPVTLGLRHSPGSAPPSGPQTSPPAPLSKGPQGSVRWPLPRVRFLWAGHLVSSATCVPSGFQASGRGGTVGARATGFRADGRLVDVAHPDGWLPRWGPGLAQSPKLWQWEEGDMGWESLRVGRRVCQPRPFRRARVLLLSGS